jgi:hypothetical protein
MTAYQNMYYYLEGTFDGCEVSLSRASNKEADNLANIGSQCLPVSPGVFWEEIIERSIKESKKFEFHQTRPAYNSRLGG